MNRISVKWITKKGTYLELPEEFSANLAQKTGDVALIFIDSNNRKIAVRYNVEQNRLALPELRTWVANSGVKDGDQVVIEQISPSGYEFRISLETGELNRGNDNTGMYLGKMKDSLGRYETDRPFYLRVEDLVTHLFVCGVPGSGKTVLLKSIIEEAVKFDLPAVVVDLKGDLSSLALTFPALSPTEFAPWVVTKHDQNRERVAVESVENHRANLEEFGLGERDMRLLNQRASFAIFTPRHGRGIPLAISSLLEAPEDIDNLLKEDLSTARNMVSSLVDGFVRGVFAERRVRRLDKYKTFLEQIVFHAWENGDRLVGEDGLRRARDFVLNAPFDEIEGMKLEKFIKQKERDELASKITMALSGGEQLWFQGVPLDIERLLSRPDSDQVPVTIINLQDLQVDDQMHVVSRLSYALYDWARKKGDAAGSPRLLFVIDEIGGGGRDSFFPSTQNPASKAGLNLLLRKGRALGLCCLFATQNPGDVDYKGLGDCGTWMVSRLQTALDRSKVIQGMRTDAVIDRVDDRLKNLEFKEFLVKYRNGSISAFRERWLLSYHTTLSESQLTNINSPGIVKWFS
jgi:DNA helicase HerA-like ATPase